MNIFSKRETVSQNIAFIGLMAAINAIFVGLASFIPVLFILIIFILPITSTLVWLFCQKRYFFIYSIATVLVCFIFFAFQITDTIFYVIPSIISGFVFGIMLEKKAPTFWILFVSSIVQAVVTYACLPLIELLFEINTIEYFIQILGLSEFAYQDYLPAAFIFVLSIIQSVITYSVLTDEISKMGRKESDKEVSLLLVMIIEYVLIALSIAFAFIYGPVSFLFMCFAIYFGVYLTSLLVVLPKKWPWICSLVNGLLTIFIYAILASYIPAPYQILVILVFFVLETLIGFSNLCLENKSNKDTIK